MNPFNSYLFYPTPIDFDSAELCLSIAVETIIITEQISIMFYIKRKIVHQKQLQCTHWIRCACILSVQRQLDRIPQYFVLLFFYFRLIFESWFMRAEIYCTIANIAFSNAMQINSKNKTLIIQTRFILTSVFCIMSVLCFY